MASKKPEEDWTGIEKHGAGYRARVSRGRKQSPSLKQFPAGTAPQEMQTWRKDERARLRLKRKQRASRGTFEGDVRGVYLPAVSTMPTYADRVREMELWIKEFGTEPTDGITSPRIRAVLNRWLTEPRGYDEDGKPLPPVSANTVNKRKRALQNFFTVTFADADPPIRNPVKSIDDFDEAPSRPRDVAYDVIARILARMPDRGRMQKGEKRKAKGGDDFSISKIVSAILAYTGLEPVQLERLDKPDVDLEFGFAILSSRRKGRRSKKAKTKIEILPLVPQAVAAFKEFDRRGLWKRKIARSGLRKAFKAAASHEGVASIRIKDLRHSFGTVVVETTDDLDLARELLMHRDMASTKIYSARVLAKRLKAKLAPLVRHFGTTAGQEVAEMAGKRRSGSTPDAPTEESRIENNH